MISARFVVLNLTGAAILAAFAVAGMLTDAVTGPAKYGVGAVGILVLIALWRIARVDFRAAKFITRHLTLVALAGTVAGMIIAFSELGGAVMNSEDALLAIGVATGLALWSTFWGIVGTLWLLGNLFMCREDEP
jgi:hypothetical protein